MSPPTKRPRLDTSTERVKRQSNTSEALPSSLPSSSYPTNVSPLGRVVPTPAVAAIGGKLNCLNAIYFHPVRTEQDYYHPTVCFSPLFVHHFFGLKEEVHGFAELLVHIFYTVDTFEVFVKVEATRAGASFINEGASSIVSSLSGGSSSELGAAAIDSSSEEESQIQNKVLSYLSKVPYPGGFHRSETSFLQAIQSPTRLQFRPPGQLVANLIGAHGLNMQVFQCSFNDSTHAGQEFSKYHRRVEWFLHFFIDACSNIDHDHRWTVLLPYICPTPSGERSHSNGIATATTTPLSPHAPGGRKRKSSSSSSSGAASPKASPKRSSLNTLSKSRKSLPSASSSSSSSSSSWNGYELVGIVTLYHFFALPLCRRRVSQFLIFPHFQGRNVGLQLLEWVFQQAVNDPSVGEITVEDPAMSFGQLRDIVGIKIALSKGVLKAEDFFPNGTSLAAIAGEEETSPRVRKMRPSQLPVEGKAAVTASKSVEGKTASKKATANGVSHKDAGARSSVGFMGDAEFKRRLKNGTKESPHQIVRLIEILSMAKIFPHPLPPPPVTPSSSSQSAVAPSSGIAILRPCGGHGRVGMKEISRDWRQMTHHELPHEHGLGQRGLHHIKPHHHSVVGAHPSATEVPATNAAAASDFHTSEAMKEIRVKIKKRIRLDHLEEFGTLTPNEQRINLSTTWNDIYMSYYRTVRKIRTAILRREFV